MVAGFRIGRRCVTPSIRTNCRTKLFSNSKNRCYKLLSWLVCLVKELPIQSFAGRGFITLKRILFCESHSLFYHACKTRWISNVEEISVLVKERCYCCILCLEPDFNTITENSTDCLVGDLRSSSITYCFSLFPSIALQLRKGFCFANLSSIKTGWISNVEGEKNIFFPLGKWPGHDLGPVGAIKIARTKRTSSFGSAADGSSLLAKVSIGERRRCGEIDRVVTSESVTDTVTWVVLEWRTC